MISMSDYQPAISATEHSYIFEDAKGQGQRYASVGRVLRVVGCIPTPKELEQVIMHLPLSRRRGSRREQQKGEGLSSACQCTGNGMNRPRFDLQACWRAKKPIDVNVRSMNTSSDLLYPSYTLGVSSGVIFENRARTFCR